MHFGAASDPLARGASSAANFCQPSRVPFLDLQLTVPMRPFPPRRWLQFRLSTWFVLVAILGWAMVTRPYWVRDSFSQFRSGQSAYVTSDRGDLIPARALMVRPRPRVNPALGWPALALATFLAWKAAWAVGPRMVRCRHAAASE
jgi:hypothetical protein